MMHLGTYLLKSNNKFCKLQENVLDMRKFNGVAYSVSVVGLVPSKCEVKPHEIVTQQLSAESGSVTHM